MFGRFAPIADILNANTKLVRRIEALKRENQLLTER
jgi:hypothetical protein